MAALPLLVGLGLVFGMPVPALADGIIDVSEDSAPPFDSTTHPAIFPNWIRVPASSWYVYECDDLTCGTCVTSSFTGVTIVNYGTATGGPGADITQVYWQYACGAGVTALQTLTYAGVWGGKPAWTWAGSVAIPNDACTICFCFASLQIYADIGSCPTDGATMALGPNFDTISSRGGFQDSCGYDGPGASLSPSPRPIQYAYKTASVDVVAPGDTVTYTVHYGRPGTPTVNNMWITDSLPAYMHYVNGSGIPAPDAGWDPEPGPPMRLRWTVGPLTTAGGPTNAVTFQATVDWGNGELFEPGSGDVAAPEGLPLENRAHIAWDTGGCASGKTSNIVGTVVRRYLFWEIGDNDLLFAPRIGVPDDEMVYSIFIKNISATRTWWDVTIWDTVPPQLDTWAPGLGFDDPCTGWTMTPSGCAPASPGRVQAGGNTILTWKLDMKPGMTLEVRWKARVQPTATSGSTAVNITSVMALGRQNIVGGTGHQGIPKNFVHLAAILLRTTYLSYLSISTQNSLGQNGWFINFYPLNKATQFEFRGIEYANVPYATAGGVSQTIGCLIGDCVNGFAGSAGCTLGSGAILGGGVGGCKAERIPAIYSAYSPLPANYGNCAANTTGTNPAIPYHLVYKVVSNSPILWQMLSGANDSGNDQMAYDPTTSLSFSGYIVYGFLRHGSPVTLFDQLTLMNTSVGPGDVLDPNLATTMHIFAWDYGTLSWNHWNSYEVGPESLVMPYGFQTSAGCNRHYRVISSQTKIVSHHGWCSHHGPDANNLGHMAPTRKTGMFISGTVEEAFYVYSGPWDSYSTIRALVTNAGAATATYRIEQYLPRNPVAIPPSGNCGGVPLNMSDTFGSWRFIKRDTVLAGFFPGSFTPANPHVYGTDYDVPIFDSPGNSAGMWRIVLESAVPIQINSGGQIMAIYSGGAMLHPSVPLGQKVGTEFWLSEPWEWAGVGCNSGPGVNTIAVFCPKTGMSALGETNQGYSASYTTTGPDQCITFMGFTEVAATNKRNIRIRVTGGNAMVNYNHCIKNHKMFTAPFMEMGVHYDIIAPAFVYIGQSFWLTVIVVDQGGTTKTDYCGSTSFSSTDPGAKIEATAMDLYNFSWTSTTACSTSPNENGVKVFVNVTMTRLGLQTIVASDTVDGSIIGLGAIMVVGVDVKLTKNPRLSVAASGDTVRFQVCWSNYSSTSAFTFVITDAVPMGTTFVPEAGTAGLVCTQPAGVVIDVAYSLTTSVTPPSPMITGNPTLNTTRWLRWTIKHVGVNSTGCACFRVAVN